MTPEAESLAETRETQYTRLLWQCCCDEAKYKAPLAACRSWKPSGQAPPQRGPNWHLTRRTRGFGPGNFVVAFESEAYLKLKQLVTLFLWFEVLNGLQQNVNSLCVGDALEARLCHMLQPVLDLRV